MNLLKKLVAVRHCLLLHMLMLTLVLSPVWAQRVMNADLHILGYVDIDGDLTIFKNFNFPTTSSDSVGVIEQNGAWFLHSFGNRTNTFLGYGAGNFTLTKGSNTGIGSGVMYGLVDGQQNTSVGVNSMQLNEDGSFNTAVGNLALRGAGGGGIEFDYNVGIGYGAGAGLTTGQSNTFIGTGAGDELTTGDSNIIIGRDQQSTGVGADSQINIGGVYKGVIDREAIINDELKAYGRLTFESEQGGDQLAGAASQALNYYKITLDSESEYHAGDVRFTGTNGHLFKVYDEDNTVVHDGGEHTVVYANMKLLSPMTNGGKSVLFSGHNYGSGGDYQVIDAADWRYGNFVDGYKISGGSIVTGIDLSETTVTSEELLGSNGENWENISTDGYWTTDGGIVATTNISAATYGSDGTVSDAELLYINSLTSNAQTQLDAKADTTDNATRTNLAQYFLRSDTTGNDIQTKAENDALYTNFTTGDETDPVWLADSSQFFSLAHNETVTGQTTFSDTTNHLVIISSGNARVGGSVYATSGFSSYDAFGGATLASSGIWITGEVGNISMASGGILQQEGSYGMTLAGGSKLFLTADGVGVNRENADSTLDVTGSGHFSTNLLVGGNTASTTYGSDGTVTDAELLYINSLTSNAQTQLGAKADTTDNATRTNLAQYFLRSDTTGTDIQTKTDNDALYTGNAPDDDFLTLVDIGAGVADDDSLLIWDASENNYRRAARGSVVPPAGAETDPVFLAEVRDSTQVVINWNLGQVLTITADWVNTDNPWADNEIASSGTWNALNTNVPTALSVGTNDATQLNITSDGGADDLLVPVATTLIAGIINSATFDAIGLNTAKVTNTDDQVGSEVNITDSGDYYTGTEVETALQEVGILIPVIYDPTAINFGDTNQEYDIDAETWVTSGDGTPDQASHLLADVLSSIDTPYDDSEFNIRELTGAATATNPLTVQFTWTSVTTFSVIKTRLEYDGSASHTMIFELYNGATWDTFITIPATTEFILYSAEILVPATYVDAGTVIGRFRHLESGLATHHLEIDYIVISSGGGAGGGALQTAIQTPSSATGDIAATNVQAAIAELDSEKEPLLSDEASLYSTLSDVSEFVESSDSTGTVLQTKAENDALYTNFTTGDELDPQWVADSSAIITAIELNTAKTGVTTEISTLVEDISPELGGDLDLLTYEIKLDSAPDSDHTASGKKGVHTNGNAGNVVFGDVVYIAADEDVEFADATDATKPGLMMAIATIATTASGEFLLEGYARDDTWEWTPGGLIYLTVTGTSTNTLSQTAPTVAGECVQVIGYATHADRMYFNPSLVLVII